jgi:glycosyltransferase involved in cell wall biosynthesis
LHIALDATYSGGPEPTGVGIYCRELLHGVAAAHPDERFDWLYRPHRFLRSWSEQVPHNCRRGLLLDGWAPRAQLFHGLNQRMPAWRPRRATTTFHDLFVLTSDYSTPEFRARFTSLAREAVSKSDLIITVSEFTANQLHELLGVERSRLRVVHHGVRMRSPAHAAREKMVLHVGAIQKRKNVARLIAAFRSLPGDWQLVLAGSEGYGAKEALADAGPRVEVTGYVSDQELATLYARASIFAFPSLDEGFGIPVIEAMANGVPVVASNTSALPEVCGDAAILIDPMQTGQLADALQRLAADPDLRESYIARGLTRASKFTWATAVEKTWRVYTELLG